MLDELGISGGFAKTRIMGVWGQRVEIQLEEPTFG